MDRLSTALRMLIMRMACAADIAGSAAAAGCLGAALALAAFFATSTLNCQGGMHIPGFSDR